MLKKVLEVFCVFDFSCRSVNVGEVCDQTTLLIAHVEPP